MIRRALLLGLLPLTLGGCSGPVQWLGIHLLYQPVPAAPGGVVRDVEYREGSGDPKHRLDLFLPAERDGANGVPVLVFVPGGGWTAGDKGLRIAGADVYGNIGRFYAARGILTAVVSYRLQPRVTWREQVADLAAAVAWVEAHAPEHGGDPDALFLAGHSAGAQLAAYVALASGPLATHGLSPRVLCGVIPVSGAGYDLADEETYALGAKRAYYEQRFRAGDPGTGWLTEASALTYLTPDAPPFLLIHGSREWKSLHHQNRLLDRALRAAGVASRRLVPTQTHTSIVLALSRDDKLPGRAVLDFLRGAECGEGGGSGGRGSRQEGSQQVSAGTMRPSSEPSPTGERITDAGVATLLWRVGESQSWVAGSGESGSSRCSARVGWVWSTSAMTRLSSVRWRSSRSAPVTG